MHSQRGRWERVKHIVKKEKIEWHLFTSTNQWKFLMI